MPKHGEQPELARILGYTSQSILYGLPPAAVAFGNHDIFATNGSGAAITPTISDGNLVGKLNALGTIGTISMSNLLSADMLDWHMVRKSADEVVNNSTTLQNDDELSFSAAANTDYIVEMMVDTTGNSSADFKHDFTGPAGATLNLVMLAHVAALGFQDQDQITAFSSAASFPSQGTVLHVIGRLYGTIATGGTSGTVQFRWAQNSAHASNTTVHEGSYLKAMKVH